MKRGPLGSRPQFLSVAVHGITVELAKSADAQAYGVCVSHICLFDAPCRTFCYTVLGTLILAVPDRRFRPH